MQLRPQMRPQSQSVLSASRPLSVMGGCGGRAIISTTLSHLSALIMATAHQIAEHPRAPAEHIPDVTPLKERSKGEKGRLSHAPHHCTGGIQQTQMGHCPCKCVCVWGWGYKHCKSTPLSIHDVSFIIMWKFQYLLTIYQEKTLTNMPRSAKIKHGHICLQLFPTTTSRNL